LRRGSHVDAPNVLSVLYLQMVGIFIDIMWSVRCRIYNTPNCMHQFDTEARAFSFSKKLHEHQGRVFGSWMQDVVIDLVHEWVDRLLHEWHKTRIS
jgi:hypothetical protein